MLVRPPPARRTPPAAPRRLPCSPPPRSRATAASPPPPRRGNPRPRLASAGACALPTLRAFASTPRSAPRPLTCGSGAPPHASHCYGGCLPPKPAALASSASPLARSRRRPPPALAPRSYALTAVPARAAVSPRSLDCARAASLAASPPPSPRPGVPLARASSRTASEPPPLSPAPALPPPPASSASVCALASMSTYECE